MVTIDQIILMESAPAEVLIITMTVAPPYDLTILLFPEAVPGNPLTAELAQLQANPIISAAGDRIQPFKTEFSRAPALQSELLHGTVQVALPGIIQIGIPVIHHAEVILARETEAAVLAPDHTAADLLQEAEEEEINFSKNDFSY
jgi:hypothetical protein